MILAGMRGCGMHYRQDKLREAGQAEPLNWLHPEPFGRAQGELRRRIPPSPPTDRQGGLPSSVLRGPSSAERCQSLRCRERIGLRLRVSCIVFSAKGLIIGGGHLLLIVLAGVR
jgi:hypothetical protein